MYGAQYMSISFQPTRLVGAIAIAMGFSSTTVFADDSTDATKLDPIVVTASKSEEKVSQVPARITVISKKEIEKNPISNLSDVLQQDASIYIKQNGGLGQVADLSLRSGRSGSTLLLKNGARLNTQNSFGPVSPEFMDLTDVDQIEILKGPASVQYGSDAISGVINLISKTPTKSGVNLTGIYGENNTYKSILNADYVDASGFYTQVGGQRLESDGTRILSSQNKNDKAGFDQKGYHAKFGYQKNAVDTSISISENQGTNVYWDSTIDSNTGIRDFKNQLINWLGSYQLNSDIKVNARYSNIKNISESTDTDWQTFQPATSHYNTETNEGDLNAIWKFTAHQNILAGVTYSKSEYDSSSSPEAVRNINTTGYYLQHQYQNNGFNTQAGVRLEDNDWFGTHTVGQIAARYQLLPLTSIYANIGTAFKAPTLENLYGSYGNTFYSNPNLKPEESTSYEIGVDQKLNYGLSAYISAYSTDVKNLISSGKIDGKTTYINVNKATIQGGEIGLKWALDNLFANAEYAYSKAQNKATKSDTSYRPRQTYTLTLGYDDGVYGVNTALISRSKANTSAANVKVSGYATIDLNAFWNVNSNVKLFTNIQNIGDIQNIVVNDFGSEYVNGGRLASVGVTLSY
ncbi:ligand-gated channel protein [Acinetobacter baylyi]|nr:ligand-gated channel protein [Acinetobacter baylyi]MAK30256.1 TonB-dependent receptor [Acinetobacter sp.]CAG67555.1 putative TonB-dependent Outer membrane receptor for vitamin B12/cobalamin transport (Btub) [Acinetobacter baylyi ADP1]KAF2375955.1 ligand-gated channel protein [Acinetobacter baylyi]KAF2377513.1 ligand-gated channel protein [Acinetobacter baylyi]